MTNSVVGPWLGLKGASSPTFALNAGAYSMQVQKAARTGDGREQAFLEVADGQGNWTNAAPGVAVGNRASITVAAGNFRITPRGNVNVFLG